MNKNEAILKDKVLEYLATTKKSAADGVIAKAIGYKDFEVGYAAEQLKNDELVELMNITSFDSNRSNEYNVTILTKGLYFFENDSFQSQYNKLKKTKRFKNIRTIVLAINAILILYFSWLSIENKRENKVLQNRVNELETELKVATDSLNSFSKDSINQNARDNKH
ncbi:hypothetical protein [Ekhidna sp.]|uniref:hypothetical protein n=1 Tax=Ekhidna sp. TaxID=2608089 RepID=UPI003B5CAECF